MLNPGDAERIEQLIEQEKAIEQRIEQGKTNVTRGQALVAEIEALVIEIKAVPRWRYFRRAKLLRKSTLKLAENRALIRENNDLLAANWEDLRR